MRRRVAVIGAGLGGVAAAAAALEGGAQVVLLDRHDTPGGATRDSAGWVWRYRDVERARLGAPDGDPLVQRMVVERLDDDLAWLRQLGCVMLDAKIERDRSVGRRIDPAATLDAVLGCLATDRLVLRFGVDVLGVDGELDGIWRVRTDDPEAAELACDSVVFAGGGHVSDLARVARDAGAPASATTHWRIRTARAGDGSTQAFARAHGARWIDAHGESLVRLMPASPSEPSTWLLHAVGELHGAGAVLREHDGTVRQREPHDWSGAWADWCCARTTGGGMLEFSAALLEQDVPAGRIGTIVDACHAAGVPGERHDDGSASIEVRAGFTHTRSGLAVDADARLIDAPPTLFAAGCDVASMGRGGIASGLAQALVLGRRAGTVAARD